NIKDIIRGREETSRKFHKERRPLIRSASGKKGIAGQRVLRSLASCFLLRAPHRGTCALPASVPYYFQEILMDRNLAGERRKSQDGGEGHRGRQCDRRLSRSPPGRDREANGTSGGTRRFGD